MKKNDLNTQLSKFGESATFTLKKTLESANAVRLTSGPYKTGELWALTFDVLLPDGKSYIEFTAVQTGWGGDAFEPSHEAA